MVHEIVFIGSSELGLRLLLQSPDFAVVEALCLEKRLTPQLADLASEHRLRLERFGGLEDFRLLVERRPVTMPFFIYQLDMLVPADLTVTYNFYNVHRGDLTTNRGPNPDVWPILNGDRETALSLHKIDDKVDSGILIEALRVPIAPSDDTVSVREKLEREFPNLVQSLREHLEGSRPGEPLRGGAYQPWVAESDFTVDLSSDSLAAIDRKIRSQRQYNGAIIFAEGSKHYVTEILDAKIREPGSEFFFAAEDRVIRTCSSSHTLTLRWNRKPKFPPPPVREPSKRI